MGVDGLVLEPTTAVGESAFCGLHPPSSESLEWRELEARRMPLLPGRAEEALELCGEELFLFRNWIGDDLDEKQGEGDLDAETVEDLEMVGERVRSIGEYGSWECNEEEVNVEGVTLSDSRLETKDLLLKVGLRGGGGGGWGDVVEKDLWRMVVLYNLCGERIGGVIGDVVEGEWALGVVRKLEYRPPPPPESRGEPMGSGIPWRRLWSTWDEICGGGGGEGEADSGTRYDMPESKLRLLRLFRPCSDDISPHMRGLLQCCALDFPPPNSAWP